MTMRRSLLVLAVLFLCSVLVLAAGHTAVDNGKDKITVTETTLAGDPSAAEGLTVETTSNQDRQMFWRTVYEAGAEPEAETEFTFYQTEQKQEDVEARKELDIYSYTAEFGISGVIDLDTANLDDCSLNGMLMKPAVDVASRTPAGESRTEVLQLNRFYEYYPMWLEVHSGGWTMDYSWELQLETRTFLENYFAIPMPDTEWVEVTVEKDEAGQVVGVNCNTYYDYYEKDEYGTPINKTSFYAETVVLDNSVYLLFCGNADFSGFRGGYGLYRIPVEMVDSWNGTTFSEPHAHLLVEELENVYPMDPSQGEFASMEPGLDDTELLLFEQTGNGLRLNVVNTGSNRVRQQLDLGKDTVPAVWYHEDLLILGYDIYDSENGTLQVLHRQNGEYGLWLETKLYPMNDDSRIFSPDFAFNGEKLAIAASWRIYQGVSHRIAVYDASGLCYAGDYQYNSDSLPDAPSFLNWDDTIYMEWKE